ncbi:MAG TPA: tripartite tricarboxylate transporter substrate-binding protein [Stellaceae bacterium]|nr:tripartite tricarboxylate transporter substrate-binding protein [Stellaceae bacterium]
MFATHRPIFSRVAFRHGAYCPRLVRWAASGAVACVVAAAVVLPARAQDDVAKFYAGKNVDLYIGSTAGGGYDSYARLVARHLGAHIPGHPTIVPINMPGAGSNKLAYYIYAVAPKDGTAMGAIFPGAVMEPLIGDKPVKHDPQKFNYVGSANNETNVCIARSDAPVKTFKDVLTHELRIASSASGGSTRDYPAVLDNVLGAKFRLVMGYPGSRQMMLALEQGEVQGMCGIAESSLAEAEPDWLPSGKMIVLAQEALKGDPALTAKGVPLTLDFAKSDEQKQLLDVLYSQQVFGRPYVLPPGVPADRVAALRKAFMATMQDPALRADAKRVRLAIDPISGADVQALVTKVYATPKPVIKKLKQAMIYKSS